MNLLIPSSFSGCWQVQSAPALFPERFVALRNGFVQRNV